MPGTCQRTRRRNTAVKRWSSPSYPSVRFKQKRQFNGTENLGTASPWLAVFKRCLSWGNYQTLRQQRLRPPRRSTPSTRRTVRILRWNIRLDWRWSEGSEDQTIPSASFEVGEVCWRATKQTNNRIAGFSAQ